MAKRDREEEREAGPEEPGIIGGVLNIFGLKLDLGTLLSDPEKVTGQLQGVRDRLKAAGGKEVQSDEEWRRGGVSVSGHIRTRGLMGNEEYHIGTMGRSADRGRRKAREAPEPAEPVEPPTDVFDEGEWITVVADVPGTAMDDLELRIEGRSFSLRSTPGSRRTFVKDLDLGAEVDPESMESTCRNGVLEVRVRKAEESSDS